VVTSVVAAARLVRPARRATAWNLHLRHVSLQPLLLRPRRYANRLMPERQTPKATNVNNEGAEASTGVEISLERITEVGPRRSYWH